MIIRRISTAKIAVKQRQQRAAICALRIGAQRLSGELAKIVIQKLNFANTPLKKAVDYLNAQFKEIGPDAANLKIVAAREVANKPVTRETTNVFLRDVLNDLAAQSSAKLTASPDGTLTLAAM